MEEQLHVKNFGPINDIEIIIKMINIFTGTTSSGKSTIAKLVSIFKSGRLNGINNPMEHFRKMLTNYNIDFNIAQNTYMRYQYNSVFYEIKNNAFKTNYSIENDVVFLNPIYIPAERVFFSTLSQSIFGLINSDISLPKWLIDFGAKFEKARSTIKRFPIDFLKANYEFLDGIDFIELPNKTKIRLAQASSGIQSIIPLLLVIQYNTKNIKKGDDLFVIEEPELNLYPSTQKDLIEFIVGRINKSNDKLIITTHSPYLLTSIDNLIQAGNVARDKKALRAEVEKLVPSELWIDFDNVACYYFNDGTAKSTLDHEISSIGPSNIDDVSLALSETFESLLTLKYAE
jgi:predicted ATP-dependent endonuclease of OLD family